MHPCASICFTLLAGRLAALFEFDSPNNNTPTVVRPVGNDHTHTLDVTTACCAHAANQPTNQPTNQPPPPKAFGVVLCQGFGLLWLGGWTGSVRWSVHARTNWFKQVGISRCVRWPSSLARHVQVASPTGVADVEWNPVSRLPIRLVHDDRPSGHSRTTVVQLRPRRLLMMTFIHCPVTR